MMGGRKRRGRPGILPAFYSFFFSPSHKESLQFFSTFFSATEFPHSCSFLFLFCRLALKNGLTHGFLPISTAAPKYLNRHTPSSQSQVYRVTQLRTDDVHCRKSAGTRPVVLNVVPVTGATFSGSTTDQLMCASLFLHLLLILMVCGGHVGHRNYCNEL